VFAFGSVFSNLNLVAYLFVVCVQIFKKVMILDVICSDLEYRK